MTAFTPIREAAQFNVVPDVEPQTQPKIVTAKIHRVRASVRKDLEQKIRGYFQATEQMKRRSRIFSFISTSV